MTTTASFHTPGIRARVAQTQTARPAGRSLIGYLLVPRPKDLVKAVVLPLSFVLAAISRGGVTTSALLRALVVWLVLELLVYQARYQWNDVRGFEADQAHPESASRGRLPGPVEKARSRKLTSLIVAAAKLMVTAAVTLVAPELSVLLLVMTVAVFAVAFVYERVRSAATGRTSEVPVPLHPALVALWVWVGAGYAVRALTGVALAVDVSPAVAVLTGLTAWALGVVFVSCRWVLEAMCFARLENGRLVWEVQPGQAREHTLGLVRWLPEDAAGAAETGPCGWRALQSRTSLVAPWHLALVVAGAAAGATGPVLVGGPSIRVCVLAAVIGGLAALVVASQPGARLVAGGLGAGVLITALAAVGQQRPVAAAATWAAALALYGCFTHQCADEVGKPLRRLFHQSSR
ncbi:MAG: putative rane protein [Frankiales bacterium]|nr:putative rane protein [Frankiales bacterium]